MGLAEESKSKIHTCHNQCYIMSKCGGLGTKEVSFLLAASEYEELEGWRGQQKLHMRPAKRDCEPSRVGVGLTV